MIKINENYNKLRSSYLFSKIAEKVKKFEKTDNNNKIIKLGIGDVTKPLSQAVINAFEEGVKEMASEETFRGYGPEQGYEFLRKAIAEYDFQSRGIDICAEDIFVSDGAKCDTGNIQEIFSEDIKIAVPDPVYPVYVDTNVMAGRTGEFKNGRFEGIIYLNGNEENQFVPLPEDIKGEITPDLIYLCFPNNPTGATATADQLKKWVDYAGKNHSLILYDAAYVAFIRDETIPHSIFEIKGAKEVAIEFRSYSKTAGFTGTRCAYTVISDKCMAYDSKGNKHSLKTLWNRRQCTKFNGVSYPVQKAAYAIFTEQGKKEIKELTDYYLENADLILSEMKKLGFSCTGGKNSPYIWVKTGKDSWESFDEILNKAAVVVTPGSGFGSCGEGYIRISAFNSRENVIEALKRLSEAL